jgi:membrane protease YdiL (CAAX protease family)
LSESQSGQPGAEHRPIDPVERGRLLVRMAVPFYLGMGGLAWAWRGLVRGEPIVRAPGIDAATAWPADDAVWTGLLLGGAVVAFSAAWTAWLPSGRAVSEFLGHALGRLSLGQTTLLAVVSGLGEELLFRGALQPELGLVFTSILFGGAHLVPRWPIALWSLYAVGIGLLFGWAFEATGSLWVPVVAHAVVNGVNLPILSRRYGGVPGGEGSGA